MSASNWASARGLVLGSLLLVGCAGAAWKDVKVEPGYKPPKSLNIVISDEGKAEGHEEALETLKSTLAEELEDSDIKATFSNGGDTGADVTVVEWDPGNRALRFFVGFGAGKGTILVKVQSPGISGSAEGWVQSGAWGGNAADAAEEAAVLIAEAIATGEVD